ncbi:hypothetical protein BDM02DRAFT_1938756 [Thelephora ganbajun]|uniref:Uncharacterized protein n=1 Tax=Thelephora ganbajun TaxID=370292 RepID=A0ACB6YZH1_THEGA|nr:hypothetical protein BDM02DRAFT_1938756 [Thelephora ganbajun]
MRFRSRISQSLIHIAQRPLLPLSRAEYTRSHHTDLREKSSTLLCSVIWVPHYLLTTGRQDAATLVRHQNPCPLTHLRLGRQGGTCGRLRVSILRGAESI